MKFPNIKYFAIFVSIIAVYFFLFFTFFEVWSSWRNQKQAVSAVKLPYVVVHIDLKGSPPKLEYLHHLLPMLKDYGVNALLLEYEDMFPYEGKLVSLSAKNCYARPQLRDFIMAAVHEDIEIIPLIQTFGHLEHALKLQEFRHLREDPDYPDSICPSNVESRGMVMQMLEQVVKFHNNISYLKHIHVGCDEVFQLNKCELCSSKGLSNSALYVDYVRYISDAITKLSPDTTVLIWDDMFRKINPLTWNKIDCFNNIEPVYWDYKNQFDLAHTSVNIYHKKFENIWAASAFKGADGPTATIPNLFNRVGNTFQWMRILQDFKMAGENRRYNFRGIILTGWSRYSHMQPLCELLPASIPSLVFNLRLIRLFQSGGVKRTLELDKIFYDYLSEGDDYFECDIGLKNVNVDSSCVFEGVALYRDLINYMYLINNTYSYMHNDLALLSADEYYSKRNYINLYSLHTKIKECNITLNEIRDLEDRISFSMIKYYESYVINEYIGYKFYNVVKQLTHILQILQSLVNSNRIWERGDAFLV